MKYNNFNSRINLPTIKPNFIIRAVLNVAFSKKHEYKYKYKLSLI